jgi:putrescine transport system ATP-binding protein
MRKGRIEQIGSPLAIYAKPETRFVADFIGQTNYLSGTVETTRDDLAHVRLHPETLTIANHGGVTVGETVEIAIRPEAIAIVDKTMDQPPPGWNSALATIERVIFMGGLSTFHLRLTNGQAITVSQTLSARLGQARPLQQGDEVSLLWLIENAVVLRGAGG